MRIRMIYSIVAAGLLAGSVLGARSQAQDSPLPAPSPIEKQLAARASDVTEVTLGKSMLAFAAKIMNGKDEDDAEARKLIEGLEGIYGRDYEFAKAGECSREEVR